MSGIKLFILLAFSLVFTKLSIAQISVIELSKEFLRATRAEQSTANVEDQLKNLQIDDLTSQLKSNLQKKVFWINIYNGIVQARLTNDPAQFDDRGKFFSKDIICIAGITLSLDKIEHGIIRKSSIKLSLGLISNPFVDKVEKLLRVGEIDPRIHFALNCGAKSCPPVAIYTEEAFENQINKSTQLYLDATSVYEKDKDLVKVTSLMSWFRGDFGNKKGSLKFLKRYTIIPESVKPNIDYLSYDWTLLTGNYIDL